MSDLCDAMRKFGKGVGNAPRYRILETLFAGPKTVGEIAKRTKLSQPLVSQHLRVLREADLVRSDRKGKEIFYTFNSEHTVRLLQRLSDALRPKKPKGKRANSHS